MVTTNFNIKTGNLESKFDGDIYLTEIVNYIIATKENSTYPRTLKIITDATKASFNFSIDDLEIILDENYKSLEKYNYIIDAIIIDNPKNTAISMLYQELAKTNKYKFGVFSTIEAATEWLANY